MFHKNNLHSRPRRVIRLSRFLSLTIAIVFLAALMLELPAPIPAAGRPPTKTPIPTMGGATSTPSTVGCTSGADCVSKMTLAEKIGQMTQADHNALTTPSDITTYFLGSLLSGGGGGPSGAGGTSTQWADMIDNYQSYALNTRLHIPLLYGVDAVHGNNNIYGAVLFPHHIGMGAAHDTALITQAEQVTRDEVLGAGARWTFAPGVMVPQDDRWGREYEGYSEVASDVQADGAAAIVGFQGSNGALGVTNILATAKHFVADGHTKYGTGSSGYLIDQGDAQITEAVLQLEWPQNARQPVPDDHRAEGSDRV